MKKTEQIRMGTKMKPELIIFDMDGLMFDTERIYYKAFQMAGEEYGIKITWNLYKSIIARNTNYIIKVLKEHLGEEVPVFELNERKRAISLEIIEKEGLKVQPGLYELLEELKKQNIKKAVATSSGRQKTMKFLEESRLTDCFDAIVCGDELEESKPNPEIFLHAAQKVNCKPEASWVLEDSKLGLTAAKRGGMRAIFVPDLVKDDEEMYQMADVVAESLSDIIKMVK